MRNKLFWAVWSGLVLLLACSGEVGRSPRSPASTDRLEVDPAAWARAASEVSCTLTQGFWKNHPEAWTVAEITIGGVLYTEEQAIAILSTPPKGGDATYILAHQLIAAKLNILNGADGSVVEATILDADAWLALHPLGSAPKGADRQTGITLAGVLDDYNNGLIGPGHCDETPSPTPSPTPTPELP